MAGPLELLKYLFSKGRSAAKAVDMSPLEGLQRLVHGPKDEVTARELIHPHTLPENGLPFDHRVIADEMMTNLGQFNKFNEGQTITFANGAGPAQGAYQLVPREKGTYIPYFASFKPGTGTPMLEDAYRAAKQMAPDQPVYLTSTPNATNFYRKQIPQGWRESEYEGNPIFMRKACGGLVAMKGKR